MRVSRLAFMVAALLAGCQDAKPSAVQVDQAWTRDTVGRTANAAVFMTITASSPDRLTGASTPVAEETDLMTMTFDEGAMAMSYIDDIALPAGKPVSLDPGGLHVWLEGLKEPLKAGQSFPLVLRFDNAGEQRIEVSVVAPTAAGPAGEM